MLRVGLLLLQVTVEMLLFLLLNLCAPEAQQCSADTTPLHNVVGVRCTALQQKPQKGRPEVWMWPDLQWTVHGEGE